MLCDTDTFCPTLSDHSHLRTSGEPSSAPHRKSSSSLTFFSFSFFARPRPGASFVMSRRTQSATVLTQSVTEEVKDSLAASALVTLGKRRRGQNISSIAERVKLKRRTREVATREVATREVGNYKVNKNPGVPRVPRVLEASPTVVMSVEPEVEVEPEEKVKESTPVPLVTPVPEVLIAPVPEMSVVPPPPPTMPTMPTNDPVSVSDLSPTEVVEIPSVKSGLVEFDLFSRKPCHAKYRCAFDEIIFRINLQDHHDVGRVRKEHYRPEIGLVGVVGVEIDTPRSIFVKNNKFNLRLGRRIQFYMARGHIPKAFLVSGKLLTLVFRREAMTPPPQMEVTPEAMPESISKSMSESMCFPEPREEIKEPMEKKTSIEILQEELLLTRNELTETQKELEETQKDLAETLYELSETRKQFGKTHKELQATRAFIDQHVTALVNWTKK